MFKDLTTDIDVEIDTSTSPVLTGKPISKVYEVAFRNNKVDIVGRFEGDANSNWLSSYTRDELPTQEAKDLYDAVVQAVETLHLSIRKSDANFKTNEWSEVAID
jgi:hypothetical protein